MTFSRFPLAALAAVAVSASPSLAGLWRHDVGEQAYLALAARPQFACVGEFGFRDGDGNWTKTEASGVYLGGGWVLTAAHFGASSFRINGQIAGVRSFTRCPGYTQNVGTLNGLDVALVRLDRTLPGVPRARLWERPLEVGETLTFVGYGLGGDGVGGATAGSNARRAGTNIVDLFGTLKTGSTPAVWSDRIFFCDFDAPDGSAQSSLSSHGSDPTPTPMEALPALADSGAPGFVERDGVFFVAGFPVTGAGAAGQGRYGTTAAYQSIPAHVTWILGVAKPCHADVDDDLDVDVQDLLGFLRAFRTGEGDFDADGDTDVADLLAFLRAFRTGFPD